MHISAVRCGGFPCVGVVQVAGDDGRSDGDRDALVLGIGVQGDIDGFAVRGLGCAGGD